MSLHGELQWTGRGSISGVGYLHLVPSKLPWLVKEKLGMNERLVGAVDVLHRANNRLLLLDNTAQISGYPPKLFPSESF